MLNTPILRARPAAAHPPALSARHALFLDFDGTLVDIAERPELVRPDPQLADTLSQAAQLVGGALAVLTGRRLESVDPLLAPLRFAGAGLHGAQLRLTPTARTVEYAKALPVDAGLRREIEGHAGLWLEDKGSTIAIHYREAPELRALALELLSRAVAGRENIEIVSGKCVYEARPGGYDKGAALKRLMQEPPFTGRVPIYVGDDVTDEDGFVVVRELGGVGIKVGPGESEAEFRLVDPQAVLIWLHAAAASAQGVPA